jgi:hypothetical protein
MVSVLAEDFEEGRIYQCSNKAYVDTIESAYVLEAKTKLILAKGCLSQRHQSTLELRSKLDLLRGRLSSR